MNNSDKSMDIIDMQSYDAGYTAGLMEGLNSGYEIGYHSHGLYVKKKKKADRKRQLYFLKQKLVGVSLLLITLVSVVVLDGDATVALLIVPVALALIFGNSKMIYETKGE